MSVLSVRTIAALSDHELEAELQQRRRLFPKTQPPDPPIRVAPCPFCHGPPVVGVKAYPDVIPDDGFLLDAYVWCHECGARGPCVDALIYERAELWGLKTRAIERWNNRTAEALGCYQAELATFPRADGYDKP